MGRGREGLAEMQKHPGAGKAAAGRAPLPERGDPKARAWGRGRGAPLEARAGFWGKEGSREQVYGRWSPPPGPVSGLIASSLTGRAYPLFRPRRMSRLGCQ